MRILFRKQRERILVWLTHEIALPVLMLLRRPSPFPYTPAQLEQMPEGTVGHALMHFISGHGLQLLKHYEKHDIKHVLLGYPPTEEGEVCLQAFMLGNGHCTFPVLASVAFGLLTMPEYHRALIGAWRRGRRVPSLGATNWFALVPEELEAVRQQLFLSV